MTESNPEKPLTWHEVIKSEQEARGVQIFAWKVVTEGAIIASIKDGKSCLGGAAIYLFQYKPQELGLTPYLNISHTFPNLIQYHDDSCDGTITNEDAQGDMELAEGTLLEYLNFSRTDDSQ